MSRPVESLGVVSVHHGEQEGDSRSLYVVSVQREGNKHFNFESLTWRSIAVMEGLTRGIGGGLRRASDTHLGRCRRRPDAGNTLI